MTNEELQKATIKADMELQRMKDKIHELYEENKQLKEDIKTFKFTIRTQEQMIDELIEKIDKAIEYIKDKLSSLNMNKSAIMRIVEPSNGYLLADVNYEIQKWERLLEILGDKE